MLDILRSLLGECPPGLDFLEYVFCFILCIFGLFIVAYIAHIPFEFIGNILHKKRR